MLNHSQSLSIPASLHPTTDIIKPTIMCKPLVCTYSECRHRETYAVSECIPMRRGKGYCDGHEEDDDPMEDDGHCQTCRSNELERIDASILDKRKNIASLDLDIMEIDWRMNHPLERYRHLRSVERENAALKKQNGSNQMARGMGSKGKHDGVSGGEGTRQYTARDSGRMISPAR